MNDFLSVLNGIKPETPPVWLMRQAGRYLPEYRELRAKAGGFLEAVFDPAMAEEITLQPLRRFPQLDAAILFSDILVIPYAMGHEVRFVAGEGIQMPSLAEKDIPYSFNDAPLQPVISTLRRLRLSLPQGKTLIGFAGSPWTVACYMISGGNREEFMAARKWAFAEPERLQDLLDQVTDATIHYLLQQIEAGADVVQLFESWGGLLSGHVREYERFIIAPTRKIVDAIRSVYKDFPIIGFPRQAGSYLPVYAAETGVNAVGIGWDMDMNWVNQILPKNFPVQGNLDPALLVSGGEAMVRAAKDIITALANRPFIFNLGHGVVPQTPVEHVAQLLETVKTFKPE